MNQHLKILTITAARYILAAGLAAAPVIAKQYQGLQYRSRHQGYTVSVFDDRTTMSNTTLSGGVELVDRGNDGTLDEKILHFAAARSAGMGGGAVQSALASSDQELYQTWFENETNRNE